MPKAPKPIRALDLFCGAGGSSCGARMAGVKIVGGIDAWETAAKAFTLNFPKVYVGGKRIEQLSIKDIKKQIGRIHLLLASPECTNHTFAKGKRRKGKREESSRKTAFQVVRFARALKPRWIVVENVVSMRRWNLYGTWKARLEKLGYHLTEVVLDAQDFGVAQSRRRLFVLGDMKAKPVAPKAKDVEPVPVNKILHSAPNNGYCYDMTPLFGRKPKRASDTRARAKRALASLGKKKSFLLVYYGTDAAGGWQTLDRPLRTITTIDRFALVKPSKHGHLMRMLQPPELAKAMGFPAKYRWPKTTRRDRVKLVGNAVSPPVMKAIVQSLIRPKKLTHCNGRAHRVAKAKK